MDFWQFLKKFFGFEVSASKPSTNREFVCISRVLESEGGYVNNPKDPGGPTNRGVTIGTLRLLGIDIDGDGDIDVDDVKKLSEADARKVYGEFYWKPIHGDMLPVGVDYFMVDTSVHSGVGRAVKILQQCIGVEDDGVFGPRTMAALNRVANHEILINKLCDRRLMFLKSIVNKKTGRLSWEEFGRGWQSRIDKVRELCMADRAGM